MKKWMVAVLMLTLSSGVAFALTPAEQKEIRFQEVKKIKEAQRAEREALKANPDAKNEKPGFWARESERSGIGNPTNGVGRFARNLNPVPFFKEQEERYNARKTSSSK